MAKKFMIGAVVVLALLAGAVIVGPSFIDSKALKQQATAQVRAATGRDLTIDGDLNIRLFPSPTLTANSVSLSNAPGAAEDSMVSLKAVEVRVALMPLLSGQVQVERVRLVGAVVNIEKFADGRTNLEFQAQAEPETQSKTNSVPSVPEAATSEAPSNKGDGGSGMDIRLDNFELADSSVIYRDASTGTVERIDDIDATLRAASLNGPFEAQGQARVRGVPLAFEMSLGQIIKERTVPVNAIVSAPGGARAQVTGAVLNLESIPRFRGKVKVQGENLAQLLNAALGAPSAPDVLAQTFALDSAVDASGADVGLSELEIQLGKSRITGSVQTTFSEGTAFDVQLKSSLIDVDEMLAMTASHTKKKNKSNDQEASAAPVARAVAPTPPKEDGATGDKAQPFAFPKDLRGTVQLTVEAIALKGGLVNDVRLVAELADGELALSQFQAMAPGVTEVAVFGFARPKDGLVRFEGDVDVTCADPSSLTGWLGVQLPAGVAERVKRVTYKSKVIADAQQVVVSAMEVTADKSKLTGGVTLALRKRLSFGADLTLDAINLDTYLNGGATPAPETSKQPSGAGSSSLSQSAASASTSAQDAVGVWSALSALNDFDANLKVRVGTLVQDGKTLKNVGLDGTLYAGALTLRSLQLGDFQGASADLSGTFTGFGSILEMAKVKITAKAKNAQQLAADFGVAGVPKGLKAVALNATAEGSVLKPRFDAQLSTLEGVFGAKGSFSVLPIAFGFDGTVTAKHSDLGTFLRTLDVGYNPSGPLGALDLKAELTTDGKTHKITQLKSTLGTTPINGDIVAQTGGVKPQVTAKVQTGTLMLDRFLPKAQGTAAVDQPQYNVTSKWGKRPDVANVIFAAFGADQLAEASANVNKRWSRERFDLSALNTLNGDFSVLSEAIQFGDYTLTSADIHASVHDGVLTAGRINGTLFGGPLQGSATVRASGTPTISSNIKLDALQVREAVQAVTKQDLAAGTLSLNTAFKATGLSPADLVGSLAGTGNLNINELDVKKGGKGSALSGVLGLVAAMNQLSLGSKNGKGLADLALAFDIQDGLATAREMKLNSSMGNGTGSGTVDIAGWGIDVAGNMTVEPNVLTSLLSKGRIGRQQLPFAVKGALDNPGVNLGVGKASTGSPSNTNANPLGSLLENVLPQGKTSAQPVNPQQPDGTLAPPPPATDLAPAQKTKKPSAQDLIQKLMKGL